MITSIRGSLASLYGTVRCLIKTALGSDYRTLNHYILEMNQDRGIEEILRSVSRCFKDILDYELFGFAIEDGDRLDVWVDPSFHAPLLLQAVERDFGSQKTDPAVRFFTEPEAAVSQKGDGILASSIQSYSVLNDSEIAKLYLVPRRKVFGYHENIISLIIRSLAISLRTALRIRYLENVAAVDPLTNCYNRRALSKYLETDVAVARRYGHELSVVMIDIDDFKKINDTHGHGAGDRVLKEVSRVIAETVRKSDFLARFGGEEFVLVLPETALYHAVQLAEKVRNAIDSRIFMIDGVAIRVTASFGVSDLRSGANTVGLLREADEMLYRAKSRGKNRVSPILLRPRQAVATPAAEPVWLAR